MYFVTYFGSFLESYIFISLTAFNYDMGPYLHNQPLDETWFSCLWPLPLLDYLRKPLDLETKRYKKKSILGTVNF